MPRLAAPKTVERVDLGFYLAAVTRGFDEVAQIVAPDQGGTSAVPDSRRYVR